MRGFLSKTLSRMLFTSPLCSQCRSFLFIIFWILFENAMAMHRAKATIIGLLETNRVYEWIITAKLRNLQEIRAVLDHRKDINATSHAKVCHERSTLEHIDSKNIESLIHHIPFVHQDPSDGVSCCTICETCSVMISSMSTCLRHSWSLIRLHQLMKMKMMLIILANINCTGVRKYVHHVKMSNYLLHWWI